MIPWWTLLFIIPVSIAAGLGLIYVWIFLDYLKNGGRG